MRDERRHDEGILKRSSAFLASLTQTSHRSAEKRDNVIEDSSWFSGSSKLNGYRSRYSTLKGYFSILNNTENELRPVLGQSTSTQTLSTSWKKNVGVNVKKSVSFSSDTSFEEKRAPYRKPTVHEVKVYHKGVLQGNYVFFVLLLYYLTQRSHETSDFLNIFFVYVFNALTVTTIQLTN